MGIILLAESAISGVVRKGRNVWWLETIAIVGSLGSGVYDVPVRRSDARKAVIIYCKGLFVS